MHSDGQWLAVARTDRELRLFDVTAPQSAPARVDLPGTNTQTVAFSPDGTGLAILGAEGWLAVYDFDKATGAAELALHLSEPVPPALRFGGEARDATWLA